MTPAARSGAPGFVIGAVATVAIAALYLGLRLALLSVRDPFFDELFTVWVVRHPVSGIFTALWLDSGPPLYYLLVHAVGALTVVSARFVSCAASLAILAAVLSCSALGERRWIAAVLLAVYPPAVYLSGEARAYALCAAFAGGAVLLLDRWADGGSRRSLAAAAVLMLLAGYTHYYGVLFFPLIIVASITEKRSLRDAALATTGLAIGYLPGFALALAQPPQAMAWLGVASPWRALLSSLQQFAFAAEYPPTFVASAPLLLRGVAVAALIAAVIPTLRDSLSRRWMIMTVVPLAGLVLITIAGRPIYYPMRFESTIALPLVLWIATSLRLWKPYARSALVMIMLISGVIVAYIAVVDQSRSEPGPHRKAAQFARLHVGASVPIVVSGLAYLEVLEQRSVAWQPPVATFPAEQASHPGWRAVVPEPRLASEAAAMKSTFLWIGEETSPELRALAKFYVLEPLFRDGGVVVARSVRRGQQ